MSFRIQCAGCRCELSIRDESLGKKVRCPRCDAVTVVPAPSQNIQLVGDEAAFRSDSHTPRRRERAQLKNEIRPTKLRRRRKALWPWLVAGIGILVIACGGFAVVTFISVSSVGLEAAQETTAKYFQAYSQKDWDTALSLYSAEFFRAMPKEQWRRSLPDVAEKLGDYQGRALVAWKQMLGQGGNQIGLTYKVQYVNGAANETFSLMSGADGKHLLITGHQINSQAFLAPKK